MILPVALPFVVVKNRIIEPVDSGIYIVKENVFRLYPDHFTLPNNIHFITK